MGNKKQAIIIVHGMGEQIPMQTVNGIIDTVWTHDPSLTNPGKPDPDTGKRRTQNASWSKPNNISDSYEMHRVTTEANINGRRTDFYEYYWAHHIQGMTLKDIYGWMRSLLWRNPFTSVPKDVFLTYVVLWAAALAGLALTVFKALPEFYKSKSDPDPASLLTAILLTMGGLALMAAGAFIAAQITSHLGDVVRYVKPYPQNIAARQRIRDGGVKMVESLTQSGRYDRIIVVAHSLGTIVAYDILTHAFARMNTHCSKKGVPILEPERAKLEAMIADAANAKTQLDIDAFQAQQNAALNELQNQGNPWSISDFITLGSPLTHAEFLLAKNMGIIREAQKRRDYPTCPPTTEYEGETGKQRFSYKLGPTNINQRYANRLRQPMGKKKLTATQQKALREADDAPRHPHHGALFGYTRWTNVFSPAKFILWGDQVSGPLAETFGPETSPGHVLRGIRDIQVMPVLNGEGRPEAGEKSVLLAHTKYWKLKDPANPPAHIKVLRRVLNLKNA